MFNFIPTMTDNDRDNITRGDKFQEQAEEIHTRYPLIDGHNGMFRSMI